MIFLFLFINFLCFLFQIREILIPMMQTDTIKNYKPILEDLVSKFIINELSTNEPVVPYEVFKRFATMLSLKLFLNLENQEAEELSKLSTSHWHGIISGYRTLQP